MFKVGDEVKCVDASNPSNFLTYGKLYEVSSLWKNGVRVIADDGEEHGIFFDRFELVKPEPQAAAIAGGLQEHSVGDYYPLAAVLYEHGDERIITIENLQTGEVSGFGDHAVDHNTFEAAYKHIEATSNSKENVAWVKGRVAYVNGRWVVAEPSNPVRVTRLRNMLHRG
jgi:hypothetical protein